MATNQKKDPSEKSRKSSFAGFVAKPLHASQLEAAADATKDIPLTGEIAVRAPLVSQQLAPTHGADNSAPVHEYIVGKSYDVPIVLIESNPYGPRYFYAQSDVDEMQIKLQESRQEVAAIGYVNEAGSITLLDGETRLRASRQARFKTLRVEIVEEPTNPREMYERSRNVNVDRNAQTPFDDAYRWKDLLDKGIYKSQKEIADYSGIPEAEVSRRIHLASMSKQVIEFIYQYPQLRNNAKMLNELRQYFDVAGEELTINLVMEVAKEDLGSRDVNMRRAALGLGEKTPAAKTSRPRSERDVVSFGETTGELKVFKDRLELSFKGLSSDDAEEIRILIKGALSKKSAS